MTPARMLQIRDKTAPESRPSTWVMGGHWAISEAQLLDLEELLDMGLLTVRDIVGYLWAIGEDC